MLLNVLFSTLLLAVLGTDAEYVSYKIKKDVTLTCNATNKDDVTWQKQTSDSKGDNSKVTITNNDRFNINENGELRIHKLTVEDAGNYTCTSGGQTVKLELASLPVVTIDPKKSITVVSGDAVKISCSATGSPLPLPIWKNEAGESVGNVTEEVSGDTVKVTLSIKDVVEEHAGVYICTASVPGWDHEVTEKVILRVKDKLAALWPFLGICAEVAILCIIIFLYEHRRMKQSKAEMEADEKNNTKKAGGDESPSEVRQRK